MKHASLITDIERFLDRTGMGPSYFGKCAAGNSELVQRLRSGGRIWPETEERVRDYMASNLLTPDVLACTEDNGPQKADCQDSGNNA